MTVTSGSLGPNAVARSQRHSPTITKQGIYETSSVALHTLGERLEIGDRVFHYAKAGTVALADGKLLQGAIVISTHVDMLVAATSAIGSRKVTVTLGATNAVTENQYAEGYLHFNNEIPEGTAYKIANHPAADAAAAVVITLFDPLYKACTISVSKASLTYNPWAGLLVGPTAALTAPPKGVALVDVTASYYFWAQTWGPCAVLTNGTIVAGQNVGWITGADGAVGLMSAYTTAKIGTVLSVNATTEYSLIDLCIAP